MREYFFILFFKNKFGFLVSVVYKNIDFLFRFVYQDSRERMLEDRAGDLGVAVKQVEFESVNYIYCFFDVIVFLKIIVFDESFILLFGVMDNVQVFVYSKDVFSVILEFFKFRIFYFQYEKDVVVLFVFSNKSSIMKLVIQQFSFVIEKLEVFLKLLQDKYKSVKKRSLTDLNAGILREEYEILSRKQLVLSIILLLLKNDLIFKFQYIFEFKFIFIYNVLMISYFSLYDRILRIRNMSFGLVYRSYSSFFITFVNSMVFLVLRSIEEGREGGQVFNK